MSNRLQTFSEIPDEWYDKEGNVIMPSYTHLSSKVQPWPFSSILIFSSMKRFKAWLRKIVAKIKA